MASLDSFKNPLNAVIVGGTGGIGAAFARHLAASDQVGKLFVTSRKTSPTPEPNVQQLHLDYADEATIELVAGQIGTQLDLVIIATGMLHENGTMPERALRELNPAQMQRNFLVNAIGPALVAKHFLPLMRKDAKSVFAALSARVGSISDNGLGGWYSYRASKAALNMLLKTASIEQKRRWPHCIVAGLHPGTVDTGLSQPFQKNVPDGKLFDPTNATADMLNVLNGLKIDDSGKVFAFDGSHIPA